MTHRHRYARLATAAVGGGILVLTAVGATAADPPGNNATIKVDGVVLDDHPNNEPHVDCKFEIDFYGYDEGDLNATVIFTAWPPTKGGTLLEDPVFVGQDPAGGGTDLDADEEYDLSELLAGIEPNPDQQGWHVKVEVDEPGGSIGADNKFKVFWVSGCDVPPGPTTTTTTTTRPGNGGSTTTTTDKPGNGDDKPTPKPEPVPTPPGAEPIEPEGPITFAG